MIAHARSFFASEQRGAPHESSSDAPLHRIRTVRLREGVSLRTVARHLGQTRYELSLQERENSDLRLSDLHRWQQALDVPVAELLVEQPCGLSPCVLDRARMVRIMKTVRLLEESDSEEGRRRLLAMLTEQLLEIMPSLLDVTAWPSHGKPRGSHELGQAYERRMQDDASVGDEWDD